MNNSESSWVGLLEDPRVADLYFDEAPDLGRCDLFSVHIDERDTGLTLGMDILRLPDKLLPEWEGKNFNAFTFFLTFAMIEDLDFGGWQYTPIQSVDIRREGERRIRVEIHGQDESLRFTADAIRMSGVKAYRASSTP
ncbi:Imm50 family immunity protein [Streptomyces sp. NPDC007100]|uniref:Imm50 family immunity protein n=1 Tax=Streptomyces sp. NPDC007100 TaxID=3155602 RepID=UPI0033F988EA